MTWINEEGEFHATVPITKHGSDIELGGHYSIHIARRPVYCDRGDWLIYVDGVGDSRIDNCDGFPRFFFGTEEEVKKQMETWVSRRSECNFKSAK